MQIRNQVALYSHSIYCNLVALLPMKPPSSPSPALSLHRPSQPSVLAWPAWRRAAVVLPALGLLWLAVAWACAEVAPL